MANVADCFLAARILSVAASSEHMPLVDIANALDVATEKHTRILKLTRGAIAKCIDAGTWREQRAAAEALLRLGARRG